MKLETIHDEMGFGIPSPQNVKAFLKLAHGKWSPAPRFAVLVGKGTYDFKDVREGAQPDAAAPRGDPQRALRLR